MAVCDFIKQRHLVELGQLPWSLKSPTLLSYAAFSFF